MKVNCDLCENQAVGSQSELIDKGWCRSTIYSPVRTTLTRCPKHSDTIESAITNILLTKKWAVKSCGYKKSLFSLTSVKSDKNKGGEISG